MTYKQMDKRINMLEEKTNDIDYSEELLNKKVWTFKYISDLYESSVNGARSDRALAYLRKVNTVVHVSTCGGIILLLFLIVVILLHN